MKKLLLLPILYLLLSPQSKAQQQLVSQNTTVQNLHYNYNNTSGTSSKHLKTIFEKLNPNNPQSITFQLDYQYNTKIYKGVGANSKSIDFSILLQAVYANNTPQYKNFTLSDELVPESVTLVMEGQRLDGTSLFTHTFPSQKIDLTGHQTTEMRKNYVDTLEQANYNLVVKEINFNYTINNSKKVTKRVENIDDYEQSSTDLRAMNSQIVAMDVDNANLDPDSLDAMKNRISKMEKNYQKIKAKTFWTELNISNYDPLQIRVQESNFTTELARKRIIVNEKIAKIHELYYQKALGQYNSNQKDLAKGTAQKALKYQKNYAPAHILIASVDYDKGEWKKAKSTVKLVLNSMQYDNETQQKAVQLGGNIKDNYLNEANAFLNSKKYDASLKALAQARDICSAKYMNCDAANLENTQRVIATAWYTDEFNEASNSYSVAQNEYRNQNFGGALNTLTTSKQKLDEAHRIYKGNSAYISSDLGLQDMYQNMNITRYECLRDNAALLFGQNDLPQALSNAKQAATLSKRHKYLNGRQPEIMELLTKIELARYQKFVADGDALKAAGKNEEAIAKYKSASELDQLYNFSKAEGVASVGDKIGSAAKDEILKQAEISKLSTNNDIIKSSLAKLKAKAKEYKLENDVDVKNSFNGLQDRICDNARSILFQGKVNEMLSARSSKDYITAEKRMKEAEAIAKQYATCGIDQSQIKEPFAEISTCAQFQRLETRLGTEEQKQEYKKAIGTIEESQKLYKNRFVENNLTKPSYLDMYMYIKNHGSGDYAYEAAKYFSNKEEKGEAFDLLKSALTKYVDRNKTRYLQEDLGIWKAKDSFDASKKWKDAIIEHIGMMKAEFKYFSKTFKKQWKVLEKQNK